MVYDTDDLRLIRIKNRCWRHYPYIYFYSLQLVFNPPMSSLVYWVMLLH